MSIYLHEFKKSVLPSLPHFHSIAKRTGIYRRSFRTALTVGTILNLIHQPRGLLGFLFLNIQDAPPLNMAAALLTYIVPFMAATYGALTALHARSPESSI